MSGPRRARVYLNDEGNRDVVYNDGRVITRAPTCDVLQIATPNVMSASQLDVAAKKGVEETQKLVRQSLFSLNLFPTTLLEQNKELVRLQRIKTWVYLPLYIFTVSVLIAYYLSALQKVQYQPLFPSYSQYLGFMQYYPQCTCSRLQTLSPPVVTMVTPPAVNYSINHCSLPSKLSIECMATPACVSSAAAVSFISLALPLSSMCEIMQTSQVSFLRGLQSTYIGSELLPTASSLEFFAYTQFMLHERLWEVSVTALLAQIVLGVEMYTGSNIELTAGSDPSARSPPGCLCSNTSFNLPSSFKFSTCTFAAPFDWTLGPSPAPPYPWTCSQLQNLRNISLSLFDVPLYRDVLHLPPGSDNFSRFNVPPSNMSVFSDTFLEFVIAFFADAEGPGTFSGLLPNATLRPGIMDVDYETYYTLCAPSSCSYFVTEHYSFISAITVALGVISGLAIILQFLVNKGVDLLEPKCCSSICVVKDDDEDDGIGEEETTAKSVGGIPILNPVSSANGVVK